MKWDVFVGNLEYSVSDELLTTIFSEVGRVVSVRMKTEAAGRPAGYGFVEFSDAPTCRAAIALLDGRLVNGRPMKGAWGGRQGRYAGWKTCPRGARYFPSSASSCINSAPTAHCFWQ